MSVPSESHAKFRRRIAIGVLAALATSLPFAEGILKNGLLELLLLSPVVWFIGASRTGEYAERALLLVVSVCLAATACDGILRTFMGPSLHYSPMNQYQRRLPALPLLGRWDPMVNVSRSVYGDLAAMISEQYYREPRLVEFRTDARGFRNAAVPSTVDLVILGDSFAAGAGVTQNRTVARLLEDRLGLSVYNLSYPGGPYEEFLNFSIEGSTLPLRPGALLVWALYAGNDLEDAGGETWDLRALPWRTGLSAALVQYRTFRNRSPLRQVWEAWEGRWRGSALQVKIQPLPDGRSMLFYVPQEVSGEKTRLEVERHANFPKIRRTLQAMKETAAKWGVQISIVILPTKGQVYRQVWAPEGRDISTSGFADAMQAQCEQIGLRCWDSLPYLRKEASRLLASSNDLLWWRDDTHMNEQGHQALADFLLQEVLTKASDLKPNEKY